jgi:choline dehydrogenase-like flavoprotein
MVSRIETAANGRATGLTYHRQGGWRFQRARHVVVAGYAIETPRLLLNSANSQFPNGLANGNGLVGAHLMVHSGPNVWATMDEEIRWYKAPPSLALSEHWNYCDDGKDFVGGYAVMSQGPLAEEWSSIVSSNKGLWGMELRREMTRYIHMAGLEIVGEVQPRLQNRVELADEEDQFGLKIPRMTFSYCDNDKRLQRHAIEFMSELLRAAGGRDLWVGDDTAHLMGGCRMGDDPETSTANADGRTWEVPNLWICDGSLFPTSGGVNPSLTIQALACRIGDRMTEMAQRGEL